MHHCIPEGVCAKQISFDVRDGNLHGVRFAGGCPGNLEAMSRLMEGMPVEHVITTLKGITCGTKPTSCADQLVTMLEALRDGRDLPRAKAPVNYGLKPLGLF